MPPEELDPNAAPPATDPPADPPAEDPVEAIRAQKDAELEALRKKQQDDLFEMAQRVATQVQPAPQPVAPSAPQFTAEDVHKAVLEGDDPAAITGFVQEQIKANDKKWEEKFNALNTNGSQYIQELAMQQARNDATMPYFNDYQAEIQNVVKQSGSSDPATIKQAYSYVTGLHMNDIIKKENEKVLRQQTEPTTLPGGSGKPSRGDEPKQHTPETFLSPEARTALERKGWSPDQYAKKIGYKDFESFAQASEGLHQQQEEQNDTWLLMAPWEYANYKKEKSAS